MSTFENNIHKVPKRNLALDLEVDLPMRRRDY